MQISDLIATARAKLGDTDGSGWSNSRLLSLINSAQRDFCRKTGAYRKTAYVVLGNNQALYTLPEDCYDIKRVEYQGEQLTVFSREDIDSSLVLPDRYAIKSNLNRKLIEIQPAFTDLIYHDWYVEGTYTEGLGMYIGDPLGVVATSDLGICIDEIGSVSAVYDFVDLNDPTEYGSICGSTLTDNVRTLNRSENEGVIARVDLDSTNDNYGFLDNIGGLSVSGSYGICTGFVTDPNYITVYYSAVPPVATWDGGSIPLDDMWFDAIVHYVVGSARQDDNDEGNYQIGEIEMAKYDAAVAEGRKIASKSYTSQVSKVREIAYRRF